MRLSGPHRLALKSHFARELGADCEVLLFGSRVDDAQRGGDVDLLVRSPRVLEHHASLAARFGIARRAPAGRAPCRCAAARPVDRGSAGARRCVGDGRGPLTMQARLAFLVETVELEAQHLLETDGRLFAAPFSAHRATALRTQVDESDRTDAFVARFGGLQDTLAAKLRRKG